MRVKRARERQMSVLNVEFEEIDLECFTVTQARTFVRKALRLYTELDDWQVIIVAKQWTLTESALKIASLEALNQIFGRHGVIIDMAKRKTIGGSLKNQGSG
jgi:hypothetical protein